MTEDTPPDGPAVEPLAIGDDAVAAGMDLVQGTALANTIDTEINKTRDYIAQRPGPPLPIANGGTGAFYESGARVNLAVPWDATGSQLKFTSPQFGRLGYEIPGLANPATLAHVTDVTALIDIVNALPARADIDNLLGLIHHLEQRVAALEAGDRP